MIKTKVHVTANFRPNAMNYKHNIRDKKVVKHEKNVDLSHYHETIIDLGDVDNFFNKLFKDSVEEYNAKQKRSDRRIKNGDYYLYIKKKKHKSKHRSLYSDGKIKPVYEIELKIGNRDNQWPNRKQLYKILRLFVKRFEQLYGKNVKIVGAFLHDDEFSISQDNKKNKIFNPPHLHLDVVFIGHALTEEECKIEDEDRERIKLEKMEEFKKDHKKWDESLWKKTDWTEYRVEKFGKALRNGMRDNCSLSAALAELGFRTAPKKQTAQIQFEREVQKQFQDFCEEMGIDVDRTKVESHSHVSTEVYTLIKENEKRAKELKKQELQNRHDRKILEAKEKEIEAKKTKVEKERIEINNKKADLEEKEKQLAITSKELTKRESIISENEKKLNTRKVLIDKKIDDYNTYIEVASHIETSISSIQNEYKEIDKIEEEAKTNYSKTHNFFSSIAILTNGFKGIVRKLKFELEKYKNAFDSFFDYTPTNFKNLADSMEKNNCTDYKEFHDKFEAGQLISQMKVREKKKSNSKEYDYSYS